MKMKFINQSKLFYIVLIIFVFSIMTSCLNDKKNNDVNDIYDGKNPSEIINLNKEIVAQYLVKIAEINLIQIQLGQLSKKKAFYVDVRELGEITENLHSGLQTELLEIAKSKLISIPNIYSKQKDILKHLSNEKGTDFDQIYCNMVIDNLDENIILCEKIFKISEDNELKKWSSTLIIKLKKHLIKSKTCLSEIEKM